MMTGRTMTGSMMTSMMTGRMTGSQRSLLMAEAVMVEAAATVEATVEMVEATVGMVEATVGMVEATVGMVEAAMTVPVMAETPVLTTVEAAMTKSSHPQSLQFPRDGVKKGKSFYPSIHIS